MNDSETRIPKEIVPEVFALAARLQSAQQQSYSLAELTQIGSEANIPPEFIQRAIQQIQAKQTQDRERQQKLKVGLITAAVVIASWGFWTEKLPLAQGHCASILEQEAGKGGRSEQPTLVVRNTQEN